MRPMTILAAVALLWLLLFTVHQISVSSFEELQNPRFRYSTVPLPETAARSMIQQLGPPRAVKRDLLSAPRYNITEFITVHRSVSLPTSETPILPYTGRAKQLFEYPTPDVLEKYEHIYVMDEPRAYYFPNFLSTEDCDEIIALAKPKMFRSRVQATEKEEALSDIRTSSQAWLQHRESSVVAKLVEKIIEITRIKEAEMVQVLNYQIGQKYVHHYDYLP